MKEYDNVPYAILTVRLDGQHLRLNRESLVLSSKHAKVIAESYNKQRHMMLTAEDDPNVHKANKLRSPNKDTKVSSVVLGAITFNLDDNTIVDTITIPEWYCEKAFPYAVHLLYNIEYKDSSALIKIGHINAFNEEHAMQMAQTLFRCHDYIGYSGAVFVGVAVEILSDGKRIYQKIR